MAVTILRLELALFSHRKMTLSSVALLFFIIMTVQGQENSNTMQPPRNANFSCRGRPTGFYADIDSNCEVYHTCDNHGNKFTYFCPKETKFCQETLVCDHAHLVDCKNAEKLISKVPEPEREPEDKSDSFRSSSALSRSFKINPEPSIFLEAPRENSKMATTFTMSSTVFLRDSKVKKVDQVLKSSSTTQRSIQFQDGLRSANEFVGNEKARNLRLEVPKTEKINERKTTAKPFSFRGNYPYSETLRSMQNNRISTTARTTTAGTEFPIPAFNIEISAANDNDPYYPKRPTSTEIYYTLEREKLNKPLGFSSTERAFSNAVHLKIPDVLPDLNSVDDLVDRRKILFIPRTKSY